MYSDLVDNIGSSQLIVLRMTRMKGPAARVSKKLSKLKLVIKQKQQARLLANCKVIIARLNPRQNIWTIVGTTIKTISTTTGLAKAVHIILTQ